MKKKIFNVLLSICTIATMIIPVNFNASEESKKEITFAWNCGGDICANILNVERFIEANNYRTNYIKSEQLLDGGKVFKASDATSYGKDKGNFHTQFFVFEGTKIANIKAKGTWEDLDVALHEDWDFKNSVKPIDPCGGNDGPSSVVHNGDRDFRLVVYDTDYQPIEFDVDPSTYTYYLGNWDPIFTNPVYDVSKTTEAKPMDYTTYLLENKLVLSGEEITSVKALNVPAKAVTITSVDNIFTIKFNSNFYSKVTFELTNRAGKKFYLRVNRSFVDVDTSRNMNPSDESGKKEAYAVFTYPSNTNYSDYDVIATITTSEGTTTKILEASNVKVMNVEGRVEEGKVFDAGVKLKKSYYALGMTKDVQSVNITVTKKDATKGTTYGGTFGGNGEGIELDLTYAKRMFEAPR